MTEKAQRWESPEAGRLSALRLLEKPLHPLPADCIRIETRAIGLNFADVFALLGLYSATPKGPFTPGLEFAGIVTGIGRQADTPLREGDCVMGVTRFGAYASHVDVQPQYCVPLPRDWDFAHGAAFLVQTLTAWYALVPLGAVRPGQTVLVHSAAGGVGLQALAICRHLRARPVGTVRSAKKQAFLSERGYEEIIVRPPSGKITAPLRALLGHTPVDCVLDAIGGRVQRESYALLGPGGRLVVFGAADLMPKGARVNPLHLAWRYRSTPRFSPLNMINENKAILAFNLIWLWDRVDLLQEHMDAMIKANLPAPYVGRRFPFQDAPHALRHLQSGDSIGKVLLER